MKNLLIALFILSSSSAFAATGKQVSKFLSGLEGSYVLADDNGAQACPGRIDIETGDRSLDLVNKDFEPDPRTPTLNRKGLYRIGKRRDRVGDDMFTYMDYLSRLTRKDEYQSVSYETRNCGWFVIVTCTEWARHWELRKLKDGRVSVVVHPIGADRDYSRFPEGECVYQPAS